MGVKAKRYRANFIEPGIVSYEDSGAGTVYVSKEAIDRMLPSFVGCPVFNLAHKSTQADEAFDYAKMSAMTPDERDALADGVISTVGYDEKSGWFWADMLIYDEDTQNNLDKGFSVSCAYVPDGKTGPNGVWHNIEYDEEVLDGVFTHMAVVDNPRYEGATVFENSKKEKTMKKTWKLFTPKSEKKNATVPVPPKPKAPDAKDKDAEAQDEEMENAADAYVEVDGEKVSLEDLIKCYQGEEAEEEVKENLLNADDEIDIGDGKKIKVSALMEAYKSKKNEVVEPTEKSTVEDVVDETKQNSKVDKKPNQNFRVLKNAAERVAEQKPTFQSRSERIAEGAKRYSLKPEATK